MPDAAELDSLLRLCEWQPDTINGKPGFRVSGRRKGYEDHSIFLPHTGAVDGLSLYHPEKNGYYWSRNILDHDAFKNGIGMLTNKENLSTTFYYRYIAQAIRPVFLPGETLVRQVVLGERIKKIELQAGSFRMQATVLPSEASNQRLHWASSDGRIAHVDSVGTVTLLRDGTCYISATSTDGTSCTSTMMLQIIDPEHPQHEYVDLGICNHLWWATMNVGAASAEEPGDYFDFQQARKISWGDHWRLPTDAEIDSLLTRCEWQWTTRNGQTGYLVTNNTVEGYRQTSIFLPAAGKMSEQGLMRWGKAGFYWTGTELPDVEGAAINLAFGMQSPIWNYCRQSERMTVRLVYSRK